MVTLPLLRSDDMEMMKIGTTHPTKTEREREKESVRNKHPAIEHQQGNSNQTKEDREGDRERTPVALLAIVKRVLSFLFGLSLFSRSRQPNGLFSFRHCRHSFGIHQQLLVQQHNSCRKTSFYEVLCAFSMCSTCYFRFTNEQSLVPI